MYNGRTESLSILRPLDRGSGKLDTGMETFKEPQPYCDE